MRALLLLTLAPAFANAQTDPALWRFIHPNAKALISIDWRRLSHSHVGNMLREKWINIDGPAIPGIEFLDDVDRFVISSPGRDPAAAEPSEPQMLIVARGHFDPAKVRRVLLAHGAKPQMFNSIAVYRPQAKGSKDMAFVVLDAQTIVIGDARSVFQGLDQNRASSDPSPIAARATELDSNYDVWAMIQGTGAMAGNRLTEMFSGGALGAEPQTFEAGVSVRNGLVADIRLVLPTEAAAKSMAAELSRLFKTVVKDKAGEPAILELEKKLKISSDGAIAKISLHLTPQELEKNARVFAASHKAAPAPIAGIRPVMSPSPAPPPPPKPEKRVIRIEGLDEGIREIPYKPERPLP